MLVKTTARRPRGTAVRRELKKIVDEDMRVFNRSLPDELRKTLREDFPSIPVTVVVSDDFESRRVLFPEDVSEETKTAVQASVQRCVDERLGEYLRTADERVFEILKEKFKNQMTDEQLKAELDAFAAEVNGGATSSS